MSVRLLVALLLLAAASPAAVEPSKAGRVRVATHYVLAGDDGRSFAQLADVSCHDGDDAAHVIVVETPERNRAVLEDRSNAPQDRWSTRLSDQESGWWVEVVTVSGLKGLKTGVFGAAEAARFRDENPLGSVTLRTSDGHFATVQGRASEEVDIAGTLVRELLRDEDFLAAIPSTVWEEMHFLAGLQGRGRLIGLGVGVHLFEVLELIRAARDARSDEPLAVARQAWEKTSRLVLPGAAREQAALADFLHHFRWLPPCPAEWR